MWSSDPRDHQRDSAFRRASDQWELLRADRSLIPHAGALLDRLADRVSRFEIVASTPMVNNGLPGLEHLEVTVRTSELGQV
ncbi:MAG TPA: hypothetical protein VF070_08700 [Streptosporangiaceae bacterium]